jgi:hypothetical protein
MLKIIILKSVCIDFGMFITNANFGGGQCLAHRARIIARPGANVQSHSL